MNLPPSCPQQPLHVRQTYRCIKQPGHGGRCIWEPIDSWQASAVGR